MELHYIIPQFFSHCKQIAKITKLCYTQYKLLYVTNYYEEVITMMTIRIRDNTVSEFYQDKRLVVEMPVDFSIDDREKANSFYDSWRKFYSLPPEYPEYQEIVSKLQKIVALSDMELWQRKLNDQTTTLVCLVTPRLKSKFIAKYLEVIRNNLGKKVRIIE